MADILVNWKRTWQVKPYETEVCELMVKVVVPLEVENPEGQVPNDQLMRAADEVVKHQQLLFRQLSQAGEQLMLERLGQKPSVSAEAAPVGRARPGAEEPFTTERPAAPRRPPLPPPLRR